MTERRSEQRYRLRVPVYGTVFPGNMSARLYDCSPSGLGLLYKAPNDPHETMDDIFLLVQGYVHQLSRNDFDLVHDSEVRASKKQFASFRKAGLRLHDSCGSDIYPMLQLFALEPWPAFAPCRVAERDNTLKMFRQFMHQVSTQRS